MLFSNRGSRLGTECFWLIIFVDITMDAFIFWAGFGSKPLHLLSVLLICSGIFRCFLPSSHPYKLTLAQFFLGHFFLSGSRLILFGVWARRHGSNWLDWVGREGHIQNIFLYNTGTVCVCMCEERCRIRTFYPWSVIFFVSFLASVMLHEREWKRLTASVPLPGKWMFILLDGYIWILWYCGFMYIQYSTYLPIWK